MGGPWAAKNELHREEDMRLEVIEPDQLTAGVLLQFEKKR
jgi:hypothetical protein